MSCIAHLQKSHSTIIVEWECGDISMSIANKTNLEAKLALLEQLWRKGNAERVIIEAQKIIREHPSGRAYNFLALAYKQRGDVVKAQKIFEELLKLNPNNTMFLSNLGNIYFDAGRLSAAEKCLKKSLDLQPDQHNAAVSLANIYAIQHQYHAALDIFKKLKTVTGVNSNQLSDLNYRIAELFRQQGPDCYDAAISHYRESSHRLSSAHLLECIYKTRTEDVFEVEKKAINDSGDSNPLLAAVQTHASFVYGTADENLFCKDPFSYIEQSALGVEDGLDNALISEILGVAKGLDFVPQTLLDNGRQTAGNLFLSNEPCVKKIKILIEQKVKAYRRRFSQSQDGFINDWPERATLHGWIISMSEGGSLRSHMHKQGWLSGSLYLSMPKDRSTVEGNLVFELEGDGYPKSSETLPHKMLDIRKGDLVLFPSSIFHRTLPFHSQDGNRVTLAFDLKPF